MVEINLGKAPDNAVPLLLARANALEAYAGVEQSLSMLLSVVLGTDMQSASIVFFRIANAKSRNQIIEALLQKRFGSAFDAFWFGVPNTPNKRGLMTLVNQLDGRRNEIIHWHTVTEINVDKDPPSVIAALGPPNFWQGSASRLNVDDLRDFIQRADFASRAINMFSIHHGQFGEPPPLTDAWREIYQQPCVYPPASNHPLART
jgi:hypothetical protein